MIDKAIFSTIDAIGGLETVRAQYHKQHFSKHVHEGYTIALIERGAQSFYRSGGTHLAGTNSIILVNADDVHTGQSAATHGWVYRAMYPLPAHFSAACATLFTNNQGVPYFPKAVVEDEHLAPQLRTLFNCLESGANVLFTETLYCSVMTQLVMRHSKTRSMVHEPCSAQPAIVRVKAYIDDEPERDISLSELAQLADLSAYHLVRQFKAYTGLTPHAYQIQARLRMARTLLKQGVASYKVALQCGFFDQSHLITHFKRTVGITPKRYQDQVVHSSLLVK